MVSHSNGKTLGNTRIHCKIYRREEELFSSEIEDTPSDRYLYDNLLSLDKMQDHYIKQYERHNKEAFDFLNKHTPKNSFFCTLEDSGKWGKMADFFKIKLPKNYSVHANKSNL